MRLDCVLAAALEIVEKGGGNANDEDDETNNTEMGRYFWLNLFIDQD